MPIYEFRCAACGKISEFQMKLADPHPVDCPSCAQPQLKKIMSLPSFHLKGGGWYSDAYDGKSNQRPASSTGENASSSKEGSSSAPAKTDASPPSSGATAPATPAAPAKPKTSD